MLTLRPVLVFCLCLWMALPARAEDRQYLGYGHLIVNDNFVARRDRWRTGSVATSFAWGPSWSGTAPKRFGDLIELRLQGEIIAPESLTQVRLSDRRYAGAISLGAHTHVSRGASEISLGADLIVTGPQTGLDNLQTTLHRVPGIPGPSDAVQARQIEDDVHLAIVAELAHRYDLGARSTLRPFLEFRAGGETLARVGVDLVIGPAVSGALYARDPVTGHRYSIIESPGNGLSFVLGADIAHIERSIFLPDERGEPGLRGLTAASRLPSRTRERLRAGLRWTGPKTTVFYGLTWHSREFRAQRDDQVTGAIQLRMRF